MKSVMAVLCAINGPNVKPLMREFYLGIIDIFAPKEMVPKQVFAKASHGAQNGRPLALEWGKISLVSSKYEGALPIPSTNFLLWAARVEIREGSPIDIGKLR